MATSREYIIIYDLPREEKSLLVKINRMLHRINAKKLQHSIWQSDDLEALKDMVRIIRGAGGQANIIEKRIIL